MIRTIKPKTTLSLIEQVKESIETQMTLNPPVIPNKTLLKWVEVYANNCFVKIEEAMRKSPEYNSCVDIYHQNFSLILSTVNQFLAFHNCSTSHTWMDRGMQDDLSSIDLQLIPKPLSIFNRNRKK